ncbi:MAG: GGDEF domain-containing protein [Candidatus Pacearchaeota archaeon]
MAVFLIIYSYFSINFQVSSLKKLVTTIQVEINSLILGLNKISSIVLTETIWILIFFASAVIAINYLLNWYFIERKNALIDELTEIYNRKAMKIWLRKEIARAERFKHPLSIAMIDIDNFKTYNDRQGHLRGDWLLKTIAKILKENTREMDFVGRYGGEEFIIIFPETEHEEAVKVAERIRKNIENTKFPGGETQPKGKITISIGLITFHKDFIENKMIEEADKLLYKAKASGRNILIRKKYN